MRSRRAKALEGQAKYELEELAKRLANPMFRLLHDIGVWVRQTLRVHKKSNSKCYYVGCSVEQYLNHFVSQFRDDMSLEDIGTVRLMAGNKLNVDHILA